MIQHNLHHEVPKLQTAHNELHILQCGPCYEKVAHPWVKVVQNSGTQGWAKEMRHAA
jgi:hypothetical protein